MSDPFDGIVVGGVDVGEASRIVRLLTAERGRISVMVRGARASRRRFAGVLEPGTLLRVELARGRGELEVLARGDRLAGPSRARDDLDRIALLAYACELCSALAPEHDRADALFKLLRVWLELLEGPALPRSGSRVALEAKALTFAGLAPRLVNCARCGEAIDPPCRFDPEAGGAVHERCGSGVEIGLEDLVLAERLRRTPLADTLEIEVSGALCWALFDFAGYHLGKPFKTASLLRAL